MVTQARRRGYGYTFHHIYAIERSQAARNITFDPIRGFSALLASRGFTFGKTPGEDSSATGGFALSGGFLDRHWTAERSTPPFVLFNAMLPGPVVFKSSSPIGSKLIAYEQVFRICSPRFLVVSKSGIEKGTSRSPLALRNPPPSSLLGLRCRRWRRS